jgi:colicin import membrane protein
LDALRARLAQLWNPPVGAQNPEEIVVTIRIRLNPDGSLASPPQVTSSGRSNLYMVSRERAAVAVMRGAPFTMLRPETYELWKDIEVTFDPRDMIRG